MRSSTVADLYNFICTLFLSTLIISRAVLLEDREFII